MKDFLKIVVVKISSLMFSVIGLKVIIITVTPTIGNNILCETFGTLSVDDVDNILLQAADTVQRSRILH